MAKRFYKMAQILNNLKEMDEYDLAKWINENVYSDGRAELCQMANKDSWDNTANSIGDNRDFMEIVARSTEVGDFDYSDSWYVYDGSEKHLYSFAGVEDMWDFYEENICDEIENSSDI